jgi:hypothetical protein
MVWYLNFSVPKAYGRKGTFAMPGERALAENQGAIGAPKHSNRMARNQRPLVCGGKRPAAFVRANALIS